MSDPSRDCTRCEERDARLPRATGQEHEHPVRRGRATRVADRKPQRALGLAAVVERHDQRRAGEANRAPGNGVLPTGADSPSPPAALAAGDAGRACP